MSVNKYRPHVLVLPEDDANRQLANGFLLHLPLHARQVQVLPEAGGWEKVRDDFEDVHRQEMDRRPERHMVLLIDFDKNPARRADVQSTIPSSLENRVFILGVWSDPEKLRASGVGSFETVGEKLADECRDGSSALWSHDLLKHNAEELERMGPILGPILFPEP